METVPTDLQQKYGGWCSEVPRDILKALTVDQLTERLQRAETHWRNTADTLPKAQRLDDIRTIMSAPAPTTAPPTQSVLKTVGLTADDVIAHPGVARIPDHVLAKMDAPTAVHRAQVAEKALATHGPAAAERILTAPATVRATEPLDKAAAAAVARGVREDLARAYGRWISDIPDAVLAKLDAAELADRCEHAEGLYRRGVQNPQPGMLTGYLENARKTLAALPADEVKAEAARLRTIGLRADNSSTYRSLLAKAEEFVAANPPAPIRPRPHLTGKAIGTVPEPGDGERYVRLSDGTVLTKADIVEMVQGSYLTKVDTAGGPAGMAKLEGGIAALQADLAKLLATAKNQG